MTDPIQSDGEAMAKQKRPLGLLDKVHDLRDLLLLLNLGARSLEMSHERNAMERGAIIAQDLISEIEAMIEAGEELA
ncbi:hypothetical protein C7U61_14740 [Rhizobium sp. JAB6]|uniref:hypothetical protein n=1 Tax=Rhizobium sp. JAB6 TaxID=2127050 RepID=UPI000D137E0D|nr:hypothetical protein [Rhizobium sp. JAB6]PST19744.1 hypothetical protein C7U61_14740 [Rhizobium sp. JAB6]